MPYMWNDLCEARDKLHCGKRDSCLAGVVGIVVKVWSVPHAEWMLEFQWESHTRRVDHSMTVEWFAKMACIYPVMISTK